MALRVPVRRVVAAKVDDRVEFQENEISLSPTVTQGEQAIALWECEKPRSLFVLNKFAAGTWTGFHKPPSINYMFVIEGELEYAVKKGGSVNLKAGDCLVAHEIDHGWRTPPDSHAIIGAVMVYNGRGVTTI